MTDFIDSLEAQLVAAHRDRRRRRFVVPRRGGAALVAAAAAVAAIVAIVVALASPESHRAATKPPAHHAATPPGTTPSQGKITVAVLNGTTVTGLARSASDTLTRNGFREGVVTDDQTDQHRQRTSVYYERGHKEAAQTVAGCLDIALDHVLPMHATVRVLADRAPVAVILGADAAP
jgi:LytR cell envelope-related transcriptional attenuator